MEKFVTVVKEDQWAWKSWLAIAQLSDLSGDWTKADEAYGMALAATKDAEVRHALLTVRSGLAPVLGTPSSPNGRVRRSAAEVEGLADSLLNYVINNPGQRAEVIAAEMAVDTNAMRPVMKKLIATGKVTTTGQRRGMTYSAV